MKRAVQLAVPAGAAGRQRSILQITRDDIMCRHAGSAEAECLSNLSARIPIWRVATNAQAPTLVGSIAASACRTEDKAA